LQWKKIIIEKGEKIVSLQNGVGEIITDRNLDLDERIFLGQIKTRSL